MAIRTSRWLTTLVTAILACGPGKPGTTEDDTTSASGSTTSTQPTSSTEDSGRVPADCVPDESTDPRAIACAMRGEADCNGPLDEGSVCQWIATTIHALNAATCEAASPGAACVALWYYGDGCGVSACGDDIVAGNVYFRTNAACEIEVSVDFFCGDDVVDWTACALEGPATETGAPPPPTPEPAACMCAC